MNVTESACLIVLLPRFDANLAQAKLLAKDVTVATMLVYYVTVRSVEQLRTSFRRDVDILLL
jgi:hypothetical protein